MAIQQAGNTSPHRGGGASFLKSSCLQLAAPCLGRRIRFLDPSRGSPRGSALGLGRAGNFAAIAQVCPAPFLVAERGGSYQSGVVEPRRNLSQDVTTLLSWIRCPGSRRVREQATPRELPESDGRRATSPRSERNLPMLLVDIINTAASSVSSSPERHRATERRDTGGGYRHVFEGGLFPGRPDCCLDHGKARVR